MRRVLLVLVGVLVAALLLNAWLMGRETRPAGAEGGEIVHLPGGDLHVVDEGPRGGPALVLIHGATGSVRWWQEAARAMRGSRRVIRFDNLGNGGSEKPRDGYAVEDQADLIAAALRKLRVRKAVVAGYSAGGTTATALALRHPSLVRALVVVGTAPARRWFDYKLPSRLAVAPVIGPALRRLTPDALVRRSSEQAFAPGFEVPDWVVDDYRKTTFSSFRKPRSAQLDYLDERPLPSRLAGRRLPLLVVFGREDRLVDPDAVRDWRRVPGARVEVLLGAGHTPIVERPTQATRLIREFMRAVGSRSAKR